MIAANRLSRGPSRPVQCIIALLVAYSLAILAVEASTSQQVVRHYLSDVSESEPLFAINTTLSSSLLWSSALLFVVAARLPQAGHSADSWWPWSQALIFFYLGIDDRFLFHETLSRQFGIGDHYFLLAIALVEVGLLTYGWHKGWLPGSAVRCLWCASLMFAAMWGIDALAPHDAKMRLSVEDLCKTWSCFFFACFAWVTLHARIARLRPQQYFESHQLPIARRASLMSVEANQ